MTSNYSTIEVKAEKAEYNNETSHSIWDVTFYMLCIKNVNVTFHILMIYITLYHTY